jgi:hypothetical protein
LESLEDLEKEIESRFRILVNAIIFYKSCKYLNNPKTEEEKNVSDSNAFIRKTRYAFWVLSVLELCKLYGKKGDHFTFEKLLNKLLMNFDSKPWSFNLQKEQIILWSERIRDQDFKNTINKLHGLRDKYYAHSDRNPEEEINALTPEYEEVELLIDFGKEIVFEIRSKVFDIHQLFETPNMGNANNILRNLLELRSFRLKEIQ